MSQDTQTQSSVPSVALATIPATSNPCEVEIAGEGFCLRLSTSQILQWIAPGASEGDAYRFLLTAKAMGLNPLTGEIHLVKFGAKWSPIISKVGLLKRAQSHPSLKSLRAGIIVREVKPDKTFGPITELEGTFRPPQHALLGGWCEIRRSDRTTPTIAKVGMDEYGKQGGVWQQYPATMICTVAIRHAIGEAFPAGECWSEAEVEPQVLTRATHSPPSLAIAPPIVAEAVTDDDDDDDDVGTHTTNPNAGPSAWNRVRRYLQYLTVSDETVEKILRNRNVESISDLSYFGAMELARSLKEYARIAGVSTDDWDNEDRPEFLKE